MAARPVKTRTIVVINLDFTELEITRSHTFVKNLTSWPDVLKLFFLENLALSLIDCMLTAALSTYSSNFSSKLNANLISLLESRGDFSWSSVGILGKEETGLRIRIVAERQVLPSHAGQVQAQSDHSNDEGLVRRRLKSGW